MSQVKNTRAKSMRSPPPELEQEDTSITAEGESKADLLLDLWLRFGRFGWDAAGVGLIAFALITLVGLVSRSAQQPPSQGFLLSFWANLVAQLFGWGWPLALIAVVLLGLLCLRKRLSHWPHIPLGRVLALEILAFCILTFLAILGGWSLERAEAGQDGGFIGWGLARLLDRLLPVPWSAVFLISLMAFLAGYGSGLFHWLFSRFEGWLNEVNPAGARTTPGLSTSLSAPGEGEEDGPVAPEALYSRDPRLPPLSMLLSEKNIRPGDIYIQETARMIEHTLAEFGVPAHVVGYRVGPTVTQYAVEPGFIEKIGPDGGVVKQKVRVSQISALSRDLALSLFAERLRIEAPVPGRSYMGIEVPNQVNAVVRLRSILESEAFTRLTSPLAVAMGSDVSGQPVVADLARMPHLLIAGTTGSGKSVCIMALAACLVINNHPSDLRLILLDPKKVELIRFNGLPHLYGQVETEIERMLGVLRWVIVEMDRRYRLLEEARSRDVIVYNNRAMKRNKPTLPRIVVIIDELADLMLTAPDQTEHSLIRLAQMARATGIHLVVATQRPSTDVVTGLIKANFPARLAFTVASSIDSRVILDVNGAETLLGKGDMLFLNPEAGTPLRAQGVLVSDEELEAIANFWKQTTGEPPQEPAPWEELLANDADEDSDTLIDQAIQLVRTTQRASTSLVQRRLRIGYPRAARLMDELEELGVVGPSQGGGRERDVLLPPVNEEEADHSDPNPGNNLEDGP